MNSGAPALRDVKALDQLGERAFARTRRADDADDLPGRHAETEIVQNLRPIDAVAKRGVLEHDVAANRGEGGAGWVVRGLRRGVENVAETGDGEPRLMK